VFLNSLAGYLPILVFLTLSALFLGYLLLLKKTLTWEHQAQTASCRRGDTLDFGLTLCNKSILIYPAVQVEVELADSLGGLDRVPSMTLTLAPHERRELKLDVRFAHLGTYRVLVRQVRIQGLLGVMSVTIPGGEDYSVVVLPRICSLGYLPISQQVHQEDSRAHTSSDKDGMDYTGVRAYEWGDPIKNIHWKLSAHGGGYLTKQTETFGSAGLSVLLDLYSAETDRETARSLYDALVEGAVALSLYALEKGMESDVCYFTAQGEQTRTVFRQREELERLSWDLPGLCRDSSLCPMSTMLERAASDLYGKNNVALVTTNITPETLELLARIRLAGRYPMVFYVLTFSLRDEDIQAKTAPLRVLSAQGIPWYAYEDAGKLEKELHR
jgi:uncharacterized protein (DUF58 family)